jgi:hypothetical protein
MREIFFSWDFFQEPGAEFIFVRDRRWHHVYAESVWRARPIASASDGSSTPRPPAECGHQDGGQRSGRSEWRITKGEGRTAGAKGGELKFAFSKTYR